MTLLWDIEDNETNSDGYLWDLWEYAVYVLFFYDHQGPPGLPGIGGPRGEKVGSLLPCVPVSSHLHLSLYILKATHYFVR